MPLEFLLGKIQFLCDPGRKRICEGKFCGEDFLDKVPGVETEEGLGFIPGPVLHYRLQRVLTSFQRPLSAWGQICYDVEVRAEKEGHW